jgi:hypothetical protein
MSHARWVHCRVTAAFALELVVMRIPHVVDLNLSACEIVPEVLNWIGERCRALLHLNLSHTSITAADIANILDRTPSQHHPLLPFSFAELTRFPAERKASLQTINIRDIPNVISSFYSLTSSLLADSDVRARPSCTPL